MKRIFIVLFPLVLFISCSKKDVCNDYNPCAIAAPNSEVANVETYLASASITTAIKHCSGLYYKIDIAGTGATPNICSAVTVKYKGQLTNGTVFDQSTSGVGFQLSGLIESWKKAIPLIKAGGKLTIYAPPSLAYGSQEMRDSNGNVVIPANSILIFEVELISVF